MPSRRRYPLWRKVTLGTFFPLILVACRSSHPTIAMIPRTCGTVFWEPEHAGAASFARTAGIKIYWNAPTREDDVEGQIALLEKAVDKGYAGIILAPDETLPFRTPVRHVVAKGVPTVIVGTELGIAPSDKLSYVMTDEVAGGEMAARRIGLILQGRGSVAIVGINPQLSGITTRERSFEKTLTQEYPQIRVVARRLGYTSVPQEQQVAEELLNDGQQIDAIVALTHVSTRGAYYALVEFGKTHLIKLVGFDQGLIPPIRTGGIDSVIVQTTYDMGRSAMEILHRQLLGEKVPGKVTLQPILMTRDNLDSPEILRQFTGDWWSENE